MVIVEHLHKYYRAGDKAVPVLRDLSFQVTRGEFVAMMGASGSGKSTLLNVLGLLDTYQQGRYQLEGHDTQRLSEVQASRMRNRHIGFVFQSFHLLAQKAAWENVALPLSYRGVSRKERKVRALAMLERLGLAHRAEHRPSEMSGGQRQRVAIARALVTDPPLILADEPTGNLDTQATGEVIEILKGLHAEGKTIVLVTHEPEVAQAASRVVHMRDGQVVSDTAQAHHHEPASEQAQGAP
jgi:putative ABC transport system ATP-binding protein